MSLKVVYGSRVVSGLLRVWVSLTILWLVIMAFVAYRTGRSADFIVLGVTVPAMLLFGAAATIWIVRGFQAERR